MTAATHPFTPQTHAIGNARDGRALVLAPMTPAAAAVLAPDIVTFGPWAHYGYKAETIERRFNTTGDGSVCYALHCGAVPAGVVIVCSPWLVGPYLQMLAVLPVCQGQAVGAAVLAWYEETARRGTLRNVWLCVSGFNTNAQRFYERHGYALAGRLPDLLRDGEDELLMRKRLIPLATVLPQPVPR